MNIYSFTQKLFVFVCYIDREGEEGEGKRANRRKSKKQKLRDSNKMFANSILMERTFKRRR